MPLKNSIPVTAKFHNQSLMAKLFFSLISYVYSFPLFISVADSVKASGLEFLAGICPY